MATIPGAIRWDAWQGGGTGSEATVNAQVCQTLQGRWQSRAPWFAAPVSSVLNGINGNTQALMDAEIGYAMAAGLKYWAYCWYGQQTPVSPMQNAWALHQSSPVKANMNWCMILQFSRIGNAAGFAANVPTYVSYFQQANYQKVLTNRPLLYLFVDSLGSLTNNWGGSWANVGTAINGLRTACSSAGVGDPYVVIMYGTPASAASFASQASCQAISNYTAPGATAIAQTWASFEPTVEAYWVSLGATGTPIVPICQIGVDSRPRKQQPPVIVGTKPHFGQSVYVTDPTPLQLTTQLQAAVSYVGANPAQCPSGAILIYSWDECDEFGALIPAWTSGAPDTSKITAAANVIW